MPRHSRRNTGKNRRNVDTNKPIRKGWQGGPPPGYPAMRFEPLEQRLCVDGPLALASSGLALNLPQVSGSSLVAGLCSQTSGSPGGLSTTAATSSDPTPVSAEPSAPAVEPTSSGAVAAESPDAPEDDPTTPVSAQLQELADGLEEESAPAPSYSPLNLEPAPAEPLPEATPVVSDSGDGEATLLSFEDSGGGTDLGGGDPPMPMMMNSQGQESPEIPVAVVASKASASAIAVQWASQSDALSFTIQRSLTGYSYDFVDVGTVAGDSTSFLDTGLAEGTTYYYRVLANGEIASSDPSALGIATTAPAAPSGLQVSTNGSNFDLSWTINAAYSNGQLLEVSTDAWSSIACSSMYSSDTASAQWGPASPGVTYYFRVSAHIAGYDNNTETSGVYSDYSNGTASLAQPAGPSNLAILSSSSTDVTLSWSNNDPSQWSVCIEQASDGSSFYELATCSGGTISFTASGLYAGHSYSYRVRSYNGEYSEYSNAVEFAVPISVNPPTVNSVEVHRVDLSWWQDSSIGSYSLQRSANGSAFAEISNGSGGGWGGLCDTGLDPSTTYSYRIAAQGVGGTFYSEVVTATTLAAPSLSTGFITTHEINLAWTVPPGGTYTIERSIDGASFAGWMNIWDSGNTVDSGLSPATPYYYRITDSSGNSSPVLMVTTSELSAPNTPWIAWSGRHQVDLGIPCDTGYQRYELERALNDGEFAYLTTFYSSGSYSDWLPNSTTAHYRIRAFGDVGSNVTSSCVSITTPDAFIAPPQLSDVNNTSIHASWPWQTHGENLEFSTDGQNFTVVAGCSGGWGSYDATSLEPGTTYHFRIAAADGSGEVSEVVSMDTAPATPVLTVSTPSATEADLSWTSGGPAAVYSIERWEEGQSPMTVASGISELSWNDTSLSPATTCCYRVTAITRGGSSSADSGPVTTPPLPVGGVAATALSSHQIQLTWNPAGPAAHYDIDRSTDGENFTCINTDVTDTGFVDSEVLPGTMYYYRVTAYDSAGTATPSDTVTVTTAPDAPVDLTAQIGGDYDAITSTWVTVALAWTSGGPAVDYAVERSIDGINFEYATYSTRGIPGLTDSILVQPGATCHYRVTAFNSSGSASVTTTVTFFPVPPASVSGECLANTSVRVTWEASNGATSYQLLRSASSTGGFEVIKTIDTPSTIGIDDTAVAGNVYYYQVVAVNDGGASAPSAIASVAVNPAQPTITSIGSQHGVRLAWNSVAGADYYRVYRSTIDGTAPDGTDLFWNEATEVAGTTSCEFSDSPPGDTGTVYHYRVIAVNLATGPSSASASATYTLAPLSTPTNLLVPQWSGNWVHLTWEGSFDHGTIHVEASTDGANFAVIGQSYADANEYSAWLPQSGDNYYFRVRASDGDASNGFHDYTDYSNIVTVLENLTVPSGLSVEARSARSVSVSWSPYGAPSTSFEIEATSDGGSSTFSAEPGQVGKLIQGLSPSTTYSFRVRAVEGSGQSAWSGTVSVTTPSNAPSNLAAVAVSENQINLSWQGNDPDSEVSYVIEKATDSGGPFTAVNTEPWTQTSYPVAGLDPDTTYYFRVKAVTSGAQDSGYSNSAEALTAPAAPTSLIASPVCPSKVQLQWQNNSPTQWNVRIYVSDDEGGSWSLHGWTDEPSTGTYRVCGLQSDRTYRFRVVAYNGTESVPSNEVVVTTPSVPSVSIDPPASTTVDEGDTVSLHATAGYFNLSSLDYWWDVTLDGQSVASGAGEDFDFIPDNDGQYVVTVLVDNGEGDTASDSLTITATNAAPTVQIVGSDTGREGDEMTLYAAAYDPGDDALTYQWLITDSAAQAVASGTEEAISFTPADDGTCTVSLMVSDDDTSTTATTTIGVGDVVPTLTISGPSSIDEGATYTLTLGASDPSLLDALTGWTIDWGDGQTSSGTGSQASHVYTNGPAFFLITATASDNEGTGYESNCVGVTVGDLTPLAKINGPDEVSEGAEATWDVSVQGSGAGSVSGYIDWLGDGTVTSEVGPGQWSATHTYPDGPQTHRIKLYLRDNDHLDPVLVDARDVQVLNVSPRPSFRVLGTPTVGQAVTLELDPGADPGADNSNLTWRIDWGDGTFECVSGGPAPMQHDHTYDVEAARARIRVWLSDDDGTYKATDRTITIGHPQRTITAGLADPQETFREGLDSVAVHWSTPEQLDRAETKWIVDWGDETQSSYGGAAWNQVIAGSGAHTYLRDGVFGITVSLKDKFGTYSAPSIAVTIGELALEPVIQPVGSRTPGQPFTVLLSNAQPHADRITQWTIDWGDGTTSTAAANAWYATHTYGAASAGLTRQITAVVEGDGAITQPAAQEVTVGPGALVVPALAVDSTTTTSVTLTWTRSDRQAAFQIQQLKYWEGPGCPPDDGQMHWVDLTTVQAPFTSYTVAGLAPSHTLLANQPYQFRIRALDSGNCPSAWSPPLSVSTAQGTPPANAQNFNFYLTEWRNSTTDELESWSSELGGTAPADTTLETLYRAAPGMPWTDQLPCSGTSAWTATHFATLDLWPATTQMRYRTRAADQQCSAWSDPVSAPADAAAPASGTGSTPFPIAQGHRPDAPVLTALTAAAPGTLTASLTWNSAAGPSGRRARALVYAWKTADSDRVNGPIVEALPLEAGQTTATLTGLEPGVEYSVVALVQWVGDSEVIWSGASNVMAATTSTGSLSAPTLAASGMEGRKIRLAGHDANGVQNDGRYEVEMSVGGAPYEHVMLEFEAPADGLFSIEFPLNSISNRYAYDPGAVYSFRVRERTDTRVSDWTYSSTMLLPEATSELHHRIQSASSVEVIWTDHAANEEQFIVEYSDDDWATWVTQKVAANQNSAVLTGLEAGTAYAVRVYATNDNEKNQSAQTTDWFTIDSPGLAVAHNPLIHSGKDDDTDGVADQLDGYDADGDEIPEYNADDSAQQIDLAGLTLTLPSWVDPTTAQVQFTYPAPLRIWHTRGELRSGADVVASGQAVPWLDLREGSLSLEAMGPCEEATVEVTILLAGAAAENNPKASVEMSAPHVNLMLDDKPEEFASPDNNETTPGVLLAKDRSATLSVSAADDTVVRTVLRLVSGVDAVRVTDANGAVVLDANTTQYEWAVSDALTVTPLRLTACGEIVLVVTRQYHAYDNNNQPIDWTLSDRVVATVSEIDLDVDSDNTEATNRPLRSPEEDAIEENTPGKLLKLNAGDDDHDGIPDFADGFILPPTAGGTPRPAQAAQNVCEQFVPVILELPAWATIETPISLTYDFNDPAKVKLPTPTDPAYDLGNGSLRLWTRPGGTSRRAWSAAGSASPGDLVCSGATYTADELGMDANHLITLWVEAVRPGAAMEIEAATTFAGGVSTGGDRVSDKVVVSCTAVDLHIDSDNNNFRTPDCSDEEDRIEDTEGLPGKFIVVNTADRDRDGKIDLADGADACSDGSATQTLVPIRLDLPGATQLGQATLVFKYKASSPLGIMELDADDPRSYTLPEGFLRIWKTERGASRGQDFIEANHPYTLNALGFSTNSQGTVDPVYLYVEAVRPSTALGDLEITVEYDPDGPQRQIEQGGIETTIGQAPATGSDNVRVTALADAPMFYGDSGAMVPGGSAFGATGQDPAADTFSGAVRLADGTVSVTQTDLSSNGYGMPWGVTRTWTNQLGFGETSPNGYGWVISQTPHLIQGSSTIVEVASGRSARYFDRADASPVDPWQPDSGQGAIYTARFFVKDQLRYDADQNLYILTDSAGNRTEFYGFGKKWAGHGTTELPAAMQGQFRRFLDADGNPTTAQYADSGALKGKLIDVTRGDERFQYTYVADAPGDGLIESVTHYRTVLETERIVRKVEYEYYGDTQEEPEPQGLPGDLKAVILRAGADTILDRTVYQYWTGGINGPAHALKLVLGGSGYARRMARPGALDPILNRVSTSALRPWADYYFTYYDSGPNQGKVRDQYTQGLSPTATDGTGDTTGALHYEYISADRIGLNAWSTKTTESYLTGSRAPSQVTSDGTVPATHVYYTNFAGEVMLDVAKTSTQQWPNYTHFDAQGRVVLAAGPSALANPGSYAESNPHLVDPNATANSQPLHTAGLARVYTYTADGYLETASDRHGLASGQTTLPVAACAYTSRSVTTGTGSQAVTTTLQFLSATTVFAGLTGEEPQTTNYNRDWYADSFQPRYTVTILPAVATNHHGTGQRDQEVDYYDTYGRTTAQFDADGVLQTTEYDDATGAIKSSTVDDEVSLEDYDVHPTRRVTGDPLALTTRYNNFDLLGRPQSVTDPAGHVTTIAYTENENVRQVKTTPPAGPMSVVIDNRREGYTETTTRDREGGTAIYSATRSYVDNAGRVVESDRYFNLPPGFATGTRGTPWNPAAADPNNGNYYVTLNHYGLAGQLTWTRNPVGSYTRIVLDALGRTTQSWLGANEGTFQEEGNTFANMALISSTEYDNGSTGDSNATAVTLHPDNNAAHDRVTRNWFDWRGRLVATKQGASSAGNSDTNRPITFLTLDNLGRAVQSDIYDADEFEPTDVLGEIGVDHCNEQLLRARTTQNYDERGRVFSSSQISVNQDYGSTGDALTTGFYYDGRDNLIAQSNPGGLWSKTTIDGAGRTVAVYSTNGAGGTTYSAATSIDEDIVLTQNNTEYNQNGLPLFVVTRERLPKAAGTGALGDKTGRVAGQSAGSPAARISYVASWYDVLGRLVDVVDFGDNGGTVMTNRPVGPSERSATVLRTTNHYDDAGHKDLVTEPRGIVTKLSYDNAGRVTTQIENYITPGTPKVDANRKTRYEYTGLDQPLRVLCSVVSPPSSPNGESTMVEKRTQYVYTPTNESTQVTHATVPSTDTPDHEVYRYNRLGEKVGMTDVNGIEHQLTHDAVGRVILDQAVIPGGLQQLIDSTITQLKYSYDPLGRLILATSLGSDGTVNEVERQYNGFGQLWREKQAHDGAATDTTPFVEYGYEYANNTSHLSTITYPVTAPNTSFAVNYTYSGSNGLDASIDRVSAILAVDHRTNVTEPELPMEAYSYLGLGRVVGAERTSPNQPDLALELDQFGRVKCASWKDVLWLSRSYDYDYAYDPSGNMTLQSGIEMGYNGLQIANSDNSNAIPVNSQGVDQTLSTSLRAAKNSLLWAVGRQILDLPGTIQLDNHIARLRHLQFDAWNHVVHIEGVSDVKYDALGRATQVTDKSGPVSFERWFSGDQVISETWPDGSADLVYAPDGRMVARMQRGTTPRIGQTGWLWRVSDAEDNTRAIMDHCGSLICKYQYTRTVLV